MADPNRSALNDEDSSGFRSYNRSRACRKFEPSAYTVEVIEALWDVWNGYMGTGYGDINRSSKYENTA